MRKLGATLRALPVLVLVYVAVVGRGSLARIGAGVGAALVVALVVVAGLPPAQSTAIPVSTPDPVDARVVDALTTGHGLRQPLRVAFDAPMNASTVAAAMRLTPDTAVEFTWDEAVRVLTIRPLGAWLPDTLYVLTVSPAARAADGGTLASPVRAAVLTAKAGTGVIEATRAKDRRARIDTAFRIVVDRPVTLAAVRAAVSVEPGVVGTVTAGDAAGEFLFTPDEPLEVGTTYRISLAGLTDTDGVAFAEVPPLKVTTADAPRVVRFRPSAGEKRVERSSAVSVRFTERMDRETTEQAFRVTSGGREVKGDLSWAEGGTVLILVPDDALPYGAKVKATVAAGALSRAGVPVAGPASGVFMVEPKPKPKPKRTGSGDSGTTRSIKRTGGGGAVSGNWAGVESYYLRLMNCTRTGGWVNSKGNCSSPGGRNVAPLKMNSGISSKVARPYAKLLATRNICSHFVGGNPGDRLRRAGYTSYRWGENLGCRSGNPYSAVLGSHRYFQSEKPYNGGHYRNLMDARFKQAGIGVWVAGGRVRLVVDFYTP